MFFPSRSSQTFLPVAVQHAEPATGSGAQFLCQPPGAVGGIIVNDEQVDRCGQGADLLDELRQVLPLVVGGDDGDGAG